jgi:hypothetical protein
MKKIVLKIVFILWQLPQTVVAGFLAGFCFVTGMVVKTGCFIDSDVIYLRVLQKGHILGFTLGRFIFVSAEKCHTGDEHTYKVLKHEYGHVLQSRYLGWFYLLVIALPSVIVTGISGRLAERMYMERWADKISSPPTPLMTSPPAPLHLERGEWRGEGCKVKKNGCFTTVVFR